MEFSDYISIAAIIISLISSVVSYRSRQDALNSAKNSTLVSQTQRNESSLLANKDLFKLYNIDLDALRKRGLTPEELLFIWSDFRQGEIYHSIEGNVEDMLSGYRINFLRNEKVQIAFNEFIYGHLMSKTKFVNEMKRQIDKLSKANR